MGVSGYIIKEKLLIINGALHCKILLRHLLKLVDDKVR